MDQDLIPSVSAREQDLLAKRLELSRLSEELAQKELDLEEARLSLRHFHRRYFHTIGEKYVVLDDLLAQIEELLAETDRDNQAAQASAKQARTKAGETAREFEDILETKEPISSSVPASDECKATYRHIASIIHPDKSPDDKDKELRTRLMAELNDAYAKRDMDGMKRILAEWQENPEAVSGVGPDAELVRLVRSISQVQRRIAELEKALAGILTSDMHSLMVAVHEADLSGRDMLNEMVQDLDHRITQARQQLASLK